MSGWSGGAHLLVLGPGYSAGAFIRSLAEAPETVTVTARSGESAATLGAAGWRTVPFSGDGRSPVLADAIAGATHILASIPPGTGGDPVLRFHGEDIRRALRVRSIVYLSTVGVYGDHQGAWVDEATPPHPVSPRSVERLAAEEAWAAAAAAAEVPLATLRLAGIYGPGRNALASLADGMARRLVKPGQVFNRIHVADIAAAIGAAFDRRFAGTVNVTDDEPAPPQDVVTFAAELMGVPPPPAIPVATAVLSPMARSFYGENKRVRNRRLREELGVGLAYPTYREGLTALWRSGEGRSRSLAQHG